MSEGLNDGVQIILNRMKDHPEEFFGDSDKWKWIFKETLREVLTEPEKAAIHTAMKEVRRTEITVLATATVLRTNEEQEKSKTAAHGFAQAPVKKSGSAVSWK